MAIGLIPACFVDSSGKRFGRLVVDGRAGWEFIDALTIPAVAVR